MPRVPCEIPLDLDEAKPRVKVEGRGVGLLDVQKEDTVAPLGRKILAHLDERLANALPPELGLHYSENESSSFSQ